MLVKLTPNLDEIERRRKISKEHDFRYVPQSDPMWDHGTGIYRCSFDFIFAHEEFLEKVESLYVSDIYNPLSSFGVADNIEQILEYYKDLVADPVSKYVIAVTPVFQNKGNKGKGGGWRWYKWGPYIGKLDSQCEYLDDEDFGPDFKYVLTFFIYKIVR